MAVPPIFFSYSRADGEDFAIRLAEDLRRAGANIWIDQLDIEYGQEWDIAVEKALVASNCVLFIATEKSTTSKNVLDEVYYAVKKEKRIIPVLAGVCEIPFRLQRLHFIDFTKDYDKAFSRLLKSLKLEEKKENNSISEATKQQEKKSVSDDKKEVAEQKKAKPVIDNKESQTKQQNVKKQPLEKNKPEQTSKENTKANETGKAQDVDYGKLALEFYNKGVSSFYKSDFLEAIQYLNKAIALNPADDYNYYFKRGLANDKMGKWDEALKDYTKVHELNPNAENSYFNIAILYGNKQEYEKALPFINKAIQLKPEKANFYYQKGWTLYNMKKYNEAIPELKKAIELNPDYNSRCYNYIGLCNYSLGNEEEALKYYNQAFEADSKNSHPLINIGNAIRNRGNYTEALTYYDRAIELDNKNGLIYNNRGLCRIDLKDRKGACEDFKKAIDLGYTKAEENYKKYCTGEVNTPNNEVVSFIGKTLYRNNKQKLLEIFKKHKDSNFSLRIHPNIPEGKLKNAKKSCKIPSEDEVLAIIDLTVFGSATECFAFTDSKMYHHYWGKYFDIPYTQFPSSTISLKESSNDILFNDIILTSINKDTYVLLNDLKQLFTNK